MKGSFFLRPLEFSLRVEGETWNQGDSIRGSLLVKNHGQSTLSLSGVQVSLAYGELKKVRQKSPEAFEILKTQPCEGSGELAAGQELSCDWVFETERNSPITDASGSLFLVYGQGMGVEKLGQLQLVVQPFAVIQEFIKTFVIDYRFVVKAQRSSKGFLEVKLAPPDSKGFATLDHVAIFFKFEGETLKVRYVFNVKRIEASGASFDVKKQKKDFEQEFAMAQCLTSTGRVNHDLFVTAIKQALSEVESKLIW